MSHTSPCWHLSNLTSFFLLRNSTFIMKVCICVLMFSIDVWYSCSYLQKTIAQVLVHLHRGDFVAADKCVRESYRYKRVTPSLKSTALSVNGMKYCVVPSLQSPRVQWEWGLRFYGDVTGGLWRAGRGSVGTRVQLTFTQVHGQWCECQTSFFTPNRTILWQNITLTKGVLAQYLWKPLS